MKTPGPRKSRGPIMGTFCVATVAHVAFALGTTAFCVSRAHAKNPQHTHAHGARGAASAGPQKRFDMEAIKLDDAYFERAMDLAHGPSIYWASAPTLANETLLISGAGLDGARVTLCSGHGTGKDQG